MESWPISIARLRNYFIADLESRVRKPLEREQIDHVIRAMPFLNHVKPDARERAQLRSSAIPEDQCQPVPAFTLVESDVEMEMLVIFTRLSAHLRNEGCHSRHGNDIEAKTTRQRANLASRIHDRSLSFNPQATKLDHRKGLNAMQAASSWGLPKRRMMFHAMAGAESVAIVG